MKKIIKAGSVDQTLDLFIQDSSSTTGGGLTGLVFNTASLVCYYRKGATGAATALTLATQTVAGAHSDGGFVAIDGTNMPGMYRLDLSDTIVATAGTVSLMLKGAANMAPLTIELQLAATDVEGGVMPTVTTTTTATNVTTVNGLAANVITAASMAADAGAEIADAVWDEDATGHQTQGTFGQAIGDPVLDTNTLYKAAVTDATGATVGVDVVDLKTQIGVAGAGLTAIDLPNQTMDITGNITGNLSGSVGSVTGAVGSVTGAVGSVTGNVGGSVASVATGGIAAVSFAAGAIDAAAIAANAIGASEVNADVIDEIWDELIGDSTVTARQAMKAFMASLAGKLSGAATTTVLIRNVADDVNRITATVDADGNRSAVTLSL